MRKIQLVAYGLVIALAHSQAEAYMVGPALPVAKVAEQAGVIVKAKAIETAVSQHAWFTNYANFNVCETKFQVISVVQGNLAGPEFRFLHYDQSAKDSRFLGMFSPQWYHFEPGESYLVFARGAGNGALRQLWKNHTAVEELGVWRCASDEKLPAGISPTDAVWHELTAMLSLKGESDVVYAINQLNRMSAKRDNYAPDFDDATVLKLLVPFVKDKRPKVAWYAIASVGKKSPLMNEGIGWLSKKAKNDFVRRSVGSYPGEPNNDRARQSLTELLAVADSNQDGPTRGIAIRAMGQLDDDRVRKRLPTWTTDEAAEVRAAAAALWSEVDSDESTAVLKRLASDPSPAVRRSTAYAIGYAQRTSLMPEVEKLLDARDAPEHHVIDAAIATLLSFDPKIAGPTYLRLRKDPRFGVRFTVAAAAAYPGVYRKELAKIVAEQPRDEVPISGQDSVYTARLLLMDDLEKQPSSSFGPGEREMVMDALESSNTVGSGPYQELYRFYWTKGMRTRAAAFREKAIQQVGKSYDIDYLFKQIDGRAKR